MKKSSTIYQEVYKCDCVFWGGCGFVLPLPIHYTLLMLEYFFDVFDLLTLKKMYILTENKNESCI